MNHVISWLVIKLMKRDFLIWSIEHNAWWKPLSRGYTEKREQAGRYTFQEACKIVKGANIMLKDVPNEAMIRIYDSET